MCPFKESHNHTHFMDWCAERVCETWGEQWQLKEGRGPLPSDLEGSVLHRCALSLEAGVFCPRKFGHFGIILPVKTQEHSTDISSLTFYTTVEY